ncbi:MAG: class I SAM-dependent rRNA methyltransferase [Aerococcus suis]|nr:class I SAM-dependent rRNA methyltransferase [Aerococcus suis]
MQKLKIRTQAQQAFKDGLKLVKQNDFVHDPQFEEGEIVELVDERGHFVKQAYLAKQNKGIGWIVDEAFAHVSPASFFTKVFAKAKEKREALIKDELTTAYRIYNGEGDGVGGFSIDWYDGYALIQWYSLGIYRYREAILTAIRTIYPDCQGVVGKNRFKAENLPKSEVLAGDIPETVTVLENGLSYVTRLNDGWMTGIFLDQRDVRQYIQWELAPGRTLLNLFCYAGAFSVAAAMGGSYATTSVDVAKRTTDLVTEGWEINGLPTDGHDIYIMDVFDYYDYAAKKGQTFDVIVMDPPSFARTKKHTFKASKDYHQLVTKALDLLAPDGYLVCSTNAANVSRDHFMQLIRKGSKKAQRKLNHLQSFGLPADFPVPAGNPESDYLKVEVFQLTDED